ncbi:carboxypeptidase-like regulatory domain-containing protein [Flagellimonas nanhaiensis]|uniref:Carboxypeptidase-like regulatory domain-containing protein n=1 Tax=Flagellimonas nanhaiensis TaxID=2292706 RepID=A0A371JRQ8_9FLAO|nr:carboxypeptidase-like regulatory domain-containing protein [Allomuricauda nanhaiensis]RDY60200.1 carboxypeptidase-like regulatory domain-containing protein [Allomuricauda nanhaiensis]
MKLFKNLSITFLILFSWLIHSQEDEYFVGKLVDSSNNLPVVYATIQLKGQSIGIISNLDGSFKIPKHYVDIGNEVLISCIGYEALEVKLSNVASSQPSVIKMNIEAIELDSVTLYAEKRKKLTPRKIVKEAIKAIPENYALNFFSLLGYYREYQLERGKYVNLSEASVEVFDKGFSEIDRLTTKVRIYDRRETNDFEIDTLARLPYDYETRKKTITNAFLSDYGGNEFVILRIHDPIRNYNIDSFDFVNELQSDFLKNHSFSALGNLSLGADLLSVITFKRNHPDYVVKGKLFISKYDFSIHKIEYAIYNKEVTRKKQENDGLWENSRLIFETITEYQKVGGKMYLNYSSFQNSFKLKSPSAFRIEEISLLPGKKCIAIKFNSKPDAKSATKRNLYSIKFKNKKVRVNSIEIDDKTVLLYPELNEVDMKAAVNSLKSDVWNNNDETKIIDVKVDNITSENGDVLGEDFIKTYYQFREFFVHKVNEKASYPTEGPFMDMEKPFFGEQQIAPTKRELEIWMNTPLKTLNTSE